MRVDARVDQVRQHEIDDAVLARRRAPTAWNGSRSRVRVGCPFAAGHDEGEDVLGPLGMPCVIPSEAHEGGGGWVMTSDAHSRHCRWRARESFAGYTTSFAVLQANATIMRTFLP